MNEFMHIALEAAKQSVMNGEGGPFGAVIVRDAKVVAVSANSVIRDQDPTMHAEVSVIRKAAKELRRFNLSDCELYTTCAPCPMCLGAIYWAKIKKVYYGCTTEDAAAIGFDDAFIYRAIEDPQKYATLVSQPMEREQCLEAFTLWREKRNKTRY